MYHNNNLPQILLYTSMVELIRRFWIGREVPYSNPGWGIFRNKLTNV